MKAHDKGNDNASTNAEKKPPPTELKTETPVGYIVYTAWMLCFDICLLG